jgi:hypothetical protein
MNIRTKIIVPLLFLGIIGQAQPTFTPSEKKALDYLTKLIPEFRITKNDSAFVRKHSDKPYKHFIYERGDQAEDLEEQIYASHPGGIVGPFRGIDTLNYLFKIVSYTYSTRAKAQIIYIKPKISTTDTVVLAKTTNEYLDMMRKGKDFIKKSQKKGDNIHIKHLPWYYEKDKNKEYEHFDEVFNGKKNEPHIIKTSEGPAILYIIHEKQKAPYSVELIPIIKKG